MTFNLSCLQDVLGQKLAWNSWECPINDRSNFEPTKENPSLTLPRGSGITGWRVQRPRIEPTKILYAPPPQNNSIKGFLIFSYILLFSDFFSQPNCHQRGCNQQMIGADAEMHRQTLGCTSLWNRGRQNGRSQRDQEFHKNIAHRID